MWVLLYTLLTYSEWRLIQNVVWDPVLPLFPLSLVNSLVEAAGIAITAGLQQQQFGLKLFKVSIFGFRSRTKHIDTEVNRPQRHLFVLGSFYFPL